VGLIGHYAAHDDRAADELLTRACRELQTRGCTLAVGPMDGSTWNDYRFVTHFGNEPRFWLEPFNPPAWPHHFVRNGFRPVARYFSALNSRLQHRDCGLDRVARRMGAEGVRIRPITEQAFDEDLRAVLQVARAAFRGHLLYSDRDEDDFVEQSRRLQRLVPLGLSWLAQHCDRVVGFVFATPDLLERSLQGSIDTIIIKTLAVLPERSYAGLGQVLLAHAQQHALELGYSRAIHALMRDVGSMRRLSGRYARPFRGYTLFAKTLTP
jgi:predicted N-acetyltransferase YhbS